MLLLILLMLRRLFLVVKILRIWVSVKLVVFMIIGRVNGLKFL